MANERTYPILPCQDLDESVSFYETLGFKRTYRQIRPNPSAVVALEDIHIHLFGMDGFNPADSYHSSPGPRLPLEDISAMVEFLLAG